jgi:hypothetical protein
MAEDPLTPYPSPPKRGRGAFGTDSLAAAVELAVPARRLPQLKVIPTPISIASPQTSADARRVGQIRAPSRSTVHRSARAKTVRRARRTFDSTAGERSNCPANRSSLRGVQQHGAVRSRDGVQHPCPTELPADRGRQHQIVTVADSTRVRPGERRRPRPRFRRCQRASASDGVARGTLTRATGVTA